MRKKILAIVFAGAFAVGMVTPALAHVHPTVPANECAATADGPGNEAAPQNGANGNPPLPGLILNNTPSAVDGGAEGPGVDNATAGCGGP